MLPQLNTSPVVVIPAYQPTESLIGLVEQLTANNPEQKIIVVNDGSTGQSRDIFQQISHLQNVTTLHHAVNLGKGQALKTAFNHYLLSYPDDSIGVLTADADGQHSANDIQRLIKQLQLSQATVWLGSRQLNQNVPLRSRFGNTLTRKVFRFIVGKSVYDTQTGLRAIPRFVLPDLLRIPASRYEYELDMLVRIVRKKIEIKEIPIETIYIDGNKSSHFNPLLDSLKVYFVFLRYSAASIASACIDFGFFAVFHFLSNQIFSSLAAARVLSGTFNFLLCKKMIFKSGENMAREASKYIALAVFSLVLSYILVLGFVEYCHVNLYLSKIIADVCVFMINFAIQKVFVFHSATVRE